MMHFLQLETSWHCAVLWVVVPSAPPKDCSSSMNIIKLLQFFISIHPKFNQARVLSVSPAFFVILQNNQTYHFTNEIRDIG